MNFIPHNVALVAIFILLNAIISTVSPLSINANLNRHLKEPNRARFAYSALARKLPNPEEKEVQDTLTLYKEDGPENLWCTEDGDIVRIVPLKKSELGKLETPQFHEPSFLRGEESHKLCKRKHARNHIPSHAAVESESLETEAAGKEAEMQQIKMASGEIKNGPLVKVSSQSYQSINGKGRFFNLFGPSMPPPPPYGPQFYDPYFDGPYGPPPPYFGGPGPDPYYGGGYPPYGPGGGYW